MQNHISLCAISNHKPSGSRKGSKVGAMEDTLKELFKKQQQRAFGHAHKPIKEEQLSPEMEQSSPPQRQAPLNKKNIELLQQQHQQKENRGNSALPTVITQLDGHHRKGYSNNHDIEVAKLRKTIFTYEQNTNNLMKTLGAEKEKYQLATRDLQKSNAMLKDDVARIEKSFRDVLNKREDELRVTDRFRNENNELITKNLRLQHDLSQALSTIERSERLLEDMQIKMNTRRDEKEALAEQNRELQRQLDRVRSAMSAWTANTELAPDKTMGQTVTCAVSKLIFFGSIIAVGLAAVLQVVQASPEDCIPVECDYVREALND